MNHIIFTCIYQCLTHFTLDFQRNVYLWVLFNVKEFGIVKQLSKTMRNPLRCYDCYVQVSIISNGCIQDKGMQWQIGWKRGNFFKWRRLSHFSKFQMITNHFLFWDILIQKKINYHGMSRTFPLRVDRKQWYILQKVFLMSFSSKNLFACLFWKWYLHIL